MDEWINDADHYCPICDLRFKVYVWAEEPEVSFCPMCSTWKIDDHKEAKGDERTTKEKA